jgi:hypothetical protein
MPHGHLHVIGSEHEPRVSPDNIQPLMQSLLATLADIDFGHEREVENVRNSPTDPSVREKVITKLDQHHREKRQPYVEGLLTLQAQMRLVLRQGSGCSRLRPRGRLW